MKHVVCPAHYLSPWKVERTDSPLRIFYVPCFLREQGRVRSEGTRCSFGDSFEGGVNERSQMEFGNEV